MSIVPNYEEFSREYHPTKFPSSDFNGNFYIFGLNGGGFPPIFLRYIRREY